MFEDENCQDCVLSRQVRNPCLKGRGNSQSPLAIFLDQPSEIDDRRGKSFVSDTALFLDHNLKKMGIDPMDVYCDYILKCGAKKIPGKKNEKREIFDICGQYRFATLQNLPNLKAVCVLGSLGCEATIGSKIIGDYAGAEWRPIEYLMRDLVEHVWIGYSPAYAIHAPAESGAIFRVIWKAAEEAGLCPQVTKVPAFNFSSK